MPYISRDSDAGITRLPGDKAVYKSDPAIELLGAIDEVVACLGMARSQCHSQSNREIIFKVQEDLFILMSDIASIYEPAAKQRKNITEMQLRWLDEQINLLKETNVLPQGWIIPGDDFTGAILDYARTLVRRAERCFVSFQKNHTFQNPFVLAYLNRLSSLCFALELDETRLGDNK